MLYKDEHSNQCNPERQESFSIRNCQVYSGYHIKISDLGSLKAMYSTDYYHQLPIRWMAWEAVVRVSCRKLVLLFY